MLVDARTAQVTAAPQLPWYLTALLVSQPLHFGDYGGMPMKILWALLDIATIVVLGSGLYLWLRKGGRRPALQSTRRTSLLAFLQAAHCSHRAQRAPPRALHEQAPLLLGPVGLAHRDGRAHHHRAAHGPGV